MDKYSIFGLIKQYNDQIENFKDSDDTDSDKRDFKIATSLIITLVILGIFQLILWISALVLLVKNKNNLDNNMFNICVALLVLGLFFLPVIAPIVVIILVLTQQK